MTTVNQQAVQRPGQQAPVKKDLRALLQSEATANQLKKVLPEFLTPERLMRVALTAVMKNPKLLDCRPESVLLAIMTFAQAGIEPDGRHGHLIPYKDICQAIFDWKGLVNIAGRNGYEAIWGDIVCAHDKFRAWTEDGTKKLVHEVDYMKDRGNMIAAYTCCKKNGVFDFEVMTKPEIDKVRSRSRAANDGPWVTDYNEMAKKTVVRRMSKRWDMTIEVADAMNNDDDTPEQVTGKRPDFGPDPFIDVAAAATGTASQEAPTPQQLPQQTGKQEEKKVEKAPEKPKEKAEPKKEPVRTPEPKKEPETTPAPPQDNPDGDLGPQGEDAGKKFPPEDEPDPEPQDVATPPEGLQAALELCAFKQNPGETDDAVFSRYIAAVKNMLAKSGVTEEQFMVFLKRNQIAKGDQKLTDLSASKFAKLAKTWATVLPEIKKC